MRVEYDGLTLRSPLDSDIEPLMDAYDPSFNLGEPDSAGIAEVRERILAGRIQGHRTPTSPTEWWLELLVEAEPGTVLGWATLYPQSRHGWNVLETSSWIEVGQRGKHLSGVIRQAVLGLAFDGLGAGMAVSRAKRDSFSIQTSKHLGYKPTSPGPNRDGYWYWFLARSEWDETRPNGIEVDGHQSFAAWLNEG